MNRSILKCIIILCFFDLFLFSCHNENRSVNFNDRIIDYSRIIQRADTSFVLQFSPGRKDTLKKGYCVQDFTRIHSFFAINGRPENPYHVEIISDTVVKISIFSNKEWHIFEYVPIDFCIDKNNIIFMPIFEITDFNKDGYQDLTCWTHSNMNGNQWMLIFLFDEKEQKLIKLKNTAEEKTDDIWARPTYDSIDSTISCVQDAGIVGIYFESKYKLIKNKAYPISKYVEERSDPYPPLIKKFKGVKDRWIQIKAKNSD